MINVGQWLAFWVLGKDECRDERSSSFSAVAFVWWPIALLACGSAISRLLQNKNVFKDRSHLRFIANMQFLKKRISQYFVSCRKWIIGLISFYWEPKYSMSSFCWAAFHVPGLKSLCHFCNEMYLYLKATFYSVQIGSFWKINR